MEFENVMYIYLLVLGLILALKSILPFIFKQKKRLINLFSNLGILLLLNIFVLVMRDTLFTNFSLKDLGVILILLACYIFFFYQLYNYLKKGLGHN